MYDPSKPYRHRILDLIQDTWADNDVIEVKRGLLHPYYSIIKDVCVIDHTDGVGTKGKWLWEHKLLQTAVQDAFAMNVNDLAMLGAKAFKTNCHLTMPVDDHDAILNVISSLADLCRRESVAIVGGETAILDQSCFDISLTVSGVANPDTRCLFQDKNILLGFPSSGPHSNGFTLLRKLYHTPEPWMLQPTTLYHEKLNKITPPFAAMHITGGGFSKLFDLLSNKLDIHIALAINKIWEPIATSVRSDEFFTTFNAGIGMVVGVTPDKFSEVEALGGILIGKVTKGSRKIRIQCPNLKLNCTLE
jgi:phosphoribosylaminoimidazole (AIR) synthetase